MSKIKKEDKLKPKAEATGAYLLARPVVLSCGDGGRELQQHESLLGHLVRPRLQELAHAASSVSAIHVVNNDGNNGAPTTYIERHELRRPGVERQRGLALVDAVAGEDPPVERAVGGAPVPAAVPARRRRGPGVEVVGVARGRDGAGRKRGGLPGGRGDGRG